MCRNSKQLTWLSNHFFSLSWKKIFLFATNKNFQTATWEMRTLKFRNQLFPFSGSFTASSSSCRAELRGCKIQCVHLKNCYGRPGPHWGWRGCTTETNTGLGPIPNQIPKLVYTVTDTETRFKRKNRVTNFFHHKMATKLCCKTKFVGILFQEVRKHERNLMSKK